MVPAYFGAQRVPGRETNDSYHVLVAALPQDSQREYVDAHMLPGRSHAHALTIAGKWDSRLNPCAGPMY